MFPSVSTRKFFNPSNPTVKVRKKVKAYAVAWFFTRCRSSRNVRSFTTKGARARERNAVAAVDGKTSLPGRTPAPTARENGKTAREKALDMFCRAVIR